jgi:hypothetical protein
LCLTFSVGVTFAAMIWRASSTEIISHTLVQTTVVSQRERAAGSKACNRA